MIVLARRNLRQTGGRGHMILHLVLSRRFVLLPASMPFLVACAIGGDGIATGPCSQGVGGNASINVSPSMRANIGDKAIEAAGLAARAFLTGTPGPMAPKLPEAKEKAIAAAEQSRGEPLTKKSREEIESHVELIAHNYAQCVK